MKVIKDFPPNYNAIIGVFPVADRKGVVFTYGDVIYAPYLKRKLPKHLLVHEGTHKRQQNGNPEAWWDKYLSDVDFRLSQEIEAYRNQWTYVVKNSHNLKEKLELLDKLSTDLSDAMYGNIINKQQAKELIQNGGGIV